jgi:acetolactate synthase-1/2/3 large subunit
MALAHHPAERTPLTVRQDRHRTAELLVDVLVREGVDTVFGVPGGTIAPLYDALLDRPDIRVVTTRHEAGAMFAAAGYARATGRCGVVLVTSGPGATNCLTGVASAYCDSLPVLVLAGEVPRNLFGRGALQEGSSSFLNIVGMAKHVTKMSFELTSSEPAPAVLRRAMHTATSGRPGPVFLTVPFDVCSREVRRAGVASQSWVGSAISEPLLQKVACTLDAAKRPLIFAGSGTRWGKGPEQLRALAERLQCPVATTPKAKGVFPESHPLSLGVFGFGGHPSAAAYLEPGADVILAVGTSLGDVATDGWSPLLQATEHLIQIDADALQIGRSYEVSVGLVGPAELILERLATLVAPLARGPVCHGVRTHLDPELSKIGEANRIAAPRALWEIQRAMPTSTLFTCDIGQHLLFALHYLKIDDPLAWTVMTGLASMGSAIGAAIGIQIAEPNRPVAAICGDGGFAMSFADIATAAHERLPIAVFVLNDGRYGMVENGHRALYARTPDYGLNELDVATVARGAGARAMVVEQPDQLDPAALAEALRDGPVVVDLRIDPTVKLPRNKRFESLKNGGKA